MLHVRQCTNAPGPFDESDGFPTEDPLSRTRSKKKVSGSSNSADGGTWSAYFLTLGGLWTKKVEPYLVALCAQLAGLVLSFLRSPQPTRMVRSLHERDQL